MGTVTSQDGTTIAFDQVGEGPAVVLVDGAMCHRAFGPLPTLAQALSSRFTVYTYDRRGRGESGDTLPYTVDREVEDLAAVIAAAGGSAQVYGISSGAALALEATAAGLPITRLALYEPPYTTGDADPRPHKEYTENLTEALATDRRGDAIALFMTLVGTPAPVIDGLRNAPVWPAFEAVAPTLAYDNAILGGDTVPLARAARVAVPALVADGEQSPAYLRQAAQETAAAIPGALHQTLAGQTHDVAAEALAPVLIDFFQ